MNSQCAEIRKAKKQRKAKQRKERKENMFSKKDPHVWETPDTYEDWYTENADRIICGRGIVKVMTPEWTSMVIKEITLYTQRKIGKRTQINIE